LHTIILLNVFCKLSVNGCDAFGLNLNNLSFLGQHMKDELATVVMVDQVVLCISLVGPFIIRAKGDIND
jgi:hypothetical protein